MKISMRGILASRKGLLLLLAIIVVTISFITRIALLIKAWPQADTSLGGILTIFSIGLLYDLLNAFYIIIQPTTEYWSLKKRSFYVAGYARMFVLLFFTISSKNHRLSKNVYNNELAGNGMYELFAAYLNNELDYEQFYACLPDDNAFNL